MSGTKQGGLKARDTNIKKYGKQFYAKIGAEGGRAGGGHAFAHGKADPHKAGTLGGSISRRNGKLSEERVKEIKSLLTTRDDIVALHEDEEAEKDLLITDKGWFQYIPKDEIEPVRSHWWQRLRGL